MHGTQNCVAAVWELMRKQGGGCIVLVSSMAYYQGGLVVGTEYSASKAALVGMTRHLARNGGPLGIRCNAVAPGIIETDMTAEFTKPELEQIPLRRYGRAEDVAGPISFLCGPGVGLHDRHGAERHRRHGAGGMSTSRQCGDCTACCEGWLHADIDGIELKPGKACDHLCAAGCGIYARRPKTPARISSVPGCRPAARYRTTCAPTSAAPS